MGVSVDSPATLETFTRDNKLKHQLLSDSGRKMLSAYGAIVTDKKSPIYRLAKRAYFIVDKKGVVRYLKIQANPLDLLKPEQILKALKDSGA